MPQSVKNDRLEGIPRRATKLIKGLEGIQREWFMGLK